MKVFVTGGSGFIGSYVVDELLSRGFNPVNYDSQPPMFGRHQPHWIQGDLLDEGRLDSSLAESGAQIVIHLAAKADVFSSDWSAFASIHQGTANLLEAIDHNGEVDQLVNVSTQLVIGPGRQPRSLLDYRPYTIYGEAKAYAEGLLFQWRTPVHWLTVRPTNIWGPHHPTFADEIWRYIAKRYYLHPSTPEPVIRTYGYVRNTAEQIVGLMLQDRAKTDRQVFYVADEALDSAIWVDAFARALTGRPSRRVPVPVLRAMGWGGDLAAMLGKRLPIDSGRVLRMTESYPQPLERTFELLGRPSISLEAGVAETVQWMRDRAAAGS